MTTKWYADPLHSFVHGLELESLGSSARNEGANGGHAMSASDIWAEAVFVAICHSTNWDRLHASVTKAAAKNPDLIKPSNLAKLTRDEFCLLTGLPHPDVSSDSLRRLGMLQSLGYEAEECGFVEYLELNASSRISLAGDDGLYSTLAKLTAFKEDPLAKKMRVLVHQWASGGAFSIVDPGNVAPAVDYHLIRLYMRTSRIYPRKKATLDRFTEGDPIGPAELTEMRTAVESAMYYTAAGAGLTMEKLNHVEWQVARSFCVRNEPRCYDSALPEKPVDPDLELLALRHRGCLFVDVCRGKLDNTMRLLREPLTRETYY